MVEVIDEVHLLEQIASEEHIGTMAENLLEAMRDNPTCAEHIEEARKATKEAKKKRAMALRAKELGALGMQVRYLCIHALVHSSVLDSLSPPCSHAIFSTQLRMIHICEIPRRACSHHVTCIYM